MASSRIGAWKRRFALSSAAGLTFGFTPLAQAQAPQSAKSYDPSVWYSIAPDGAVTVNNQWTAAALDFAAKRFKNISPPNLAAFDGERTRLTFHEGNAAFMRHWPFAYALAQDASSPIRGKFSLARLPSGPRGRRADT